MYLFKNAWRSITRAKGRNILIGLIVFVIAVSSCLALSIRQAAENAEKSGLENMQVTAQISVDRESLMKNAQSAGGDMRNALATMPELSLSEMQAYAKSQYVKGFWYTLTTSVDASGSLEAVDTNGSSDTQNGTEDGADSAKGGKGFPGGRMGTQGDFTLIGYSGQDAMTDFISGASKLTSGAMFHETGTAAECLISSELATLNGLKAGSTIKLQNPNNTSEVLTLKVVGIYTNASSAQSGGMMQFQPGSDPANQILMSYNALKAITDASAGNASETTDKTTGRTTTTALRTQTAGTYQFSSVEQYEAFKEDLRTLGLSDEFTVSSQDVESYEEGLVPLQNLSKFATWFFVIVLVVGGVILVALNLFHIRERKYEIGVLTAIGMKKRKVAAQFLAELLMVTFAAILLGTGVGAAVSVPTTNALLATQISSQQEAQNGVNANFGRPGEQGDAAPGNGSKAPGTIGKAAEYVSDVSSATDWVVVLELLGVGLLLVLLSGTAAVVSVLRYDPLKILSNRS